jgi:undecaprenyl-diphosphatase
MGELIEAVVVGVLQGLTEFIPVSSSAHLELAPWLFGFGDSRLVGTLAFDVFLHLGTLVALLGYFARDWIRLARAWFASIGERRIGDDPDRRLAWLLVAATIPAGIIGLTLEEFIEAVFHGDSDAVRLAIAGALVVGGVALWLADRLGRRNRDLGGVTLMTALVIGFSQALALMPGISRSGATITAGLAMGLDRETAARFSFLLATPITFGAGVYGSRHLFADSLTANEWAAMAAGFLASMLAGFLAIGFLLAWLRRRSVLVFSLYRLAFAAAVVLLVMAGR